MDEHNRYCNDCRRWFGTHAGYESHMTHSSFHIWCKACDRDFVSEEARLAHWENNDAHLSSYCADCEWDYVDPEGLKTHDREKHPNRFCLKCDRSFDSEFARISHTASKHKDIFCPDCQLAFDTSDALKQHWRSHDKHVGTYDFICDLRFPNQKTRTEHLNADPVKHFVLSQHKDDVHKPGSNPKPEVNSKPEVIFNANVKPMPENKPKPEVKLLRCLANCSSTTIFPSMSAVMEHLENATCSKGWTIQHINNLLVKLPVASPYMIWDNIADFLAGPPRLSTNDDDQTSRGWRCYLCNESHLSPLDLQRHLQEQDCHTHYPHVVRCPHCPDHKGSFDRMSTLLRHLEQRKCGVDTNAVHGIVEDVKEKMSLNVDGKAEELKVSHQLRIDATKGGKDLIVKSSMNSK
ncbi:MAG: hypothetical protein L6R36_004053 [Xanthoria steineri]|nr:MAG: hypothetical protein L6R36_004053 [Xanthoria steineri]